MIDVLFHSIAGKKTNTTVNDILTTFLESEYISVQDKKLIKHSLEVGENGAYPERDYYKLFYNNPEIVYKSLSEIMTYAKKAHDFYRQQSIQKHLISAINESTSSEELVGKVEEVLNQKQDIRDDDDFEDYKPFLYSDACKKPQTEGCVLGVPEIDTLTGGFTTGTVVSICAFTGHGKSTTNVSMVFKNVMQGKKCCIMSVELSPDLVWLQVQARYLYEIKGMSVSAEDLIKRRLTDEMAKKVEEYDEDFKRDVVSNLMILDESVLSKNMLLNYKLLMKKFRAIEKKLGGLDLVSWDHAHQLELMYPDCGNKIIKQLQSVAKTYKNNKGERILMVLLAQCNREGEKRARKKGGVYDTQAIGDLNEIERTSSYIIFIYTSDDMKIVQETKISLSKNRLGSVLTEPVTTTFNPQVCVVGSTVEKISVSDDGFDGLGDLNIDAFDSFDSF